MTFLFLPADWLNLYHVTYTWPTALRSSIYVRVLGGAVVCWSLRLDSQGLSGCFREFWLYLKDVGPKNKGQEC